ncbi:acetylxylan esterase [Pasteurellaceae bacterium LIM206]|nr:acetylxylan esterase [Pasteurellaceae bacterium LIM206]
MKNKALLEEMRTYYGRDEVPHDFDQFWDSLIHNTSVPQDFRLKPVDFNLPQVNCYELYFAGVGGGTIYAKIVLPKSSQKVPVILSFHGYMGRTSDWSAMLSYCAAGYGFAMMDVPGQSGYSTDPAQFVHGNTVKGHIIRGAVDGPEHLFYKNVYLDVYRFTNIIAQLDGVDENALYSFGASQGGALALVAAALNPKIRTTVSIYPFLSDFRRVLEIGNTSEAYDELFRYFKFHDPFHETEDKIMETLAYIDVKNFAHRIQCPVKMVIALDDIVCYPITQMAIYNRVKTHKEYKLLPEYGHDDMHVYVSDTVFNWLCGTNIACGSTWIE